MPDQFTPAKSNPGRSVLFPLAPTGLHFTGAAWRHQAQARIGHNSGFTKKQPEKYDTLPIHKQLPVL